MGGIDFEIHYIILFAVFGRNIDFTIIGRDDDDGRHYSSHFNMVISVETRKNRFVYFLYLYMLFDEKEVNSRSVICSVSFAAAVEHFYLYHDI